MLEQDCTRTEDLLSKVETACVAEGCGCECHYEGIMLIGKSDALMGLMKLDVDNAYITAWDVCYGQVA